MFKFPDWCYSKLSNKPLFWALFWSVWFFTLWMLSSSAPKVENGPKIPHIDKVLHFGYFMIGGFCAANFFYLKDIWNWKKIILIAVLIGATVGAIDEYHQSFTPERSGNDIGDWTADMLGSLAGSLYCLFMWRRLQSKKPIQT